MESLQSLIHAYDAEFRGRLGWFAQAVDAFPNNKTMQTYKQLFTECLVGLDEHLVLHLFDNVFHYGPNIIYDDLKKAFVKTQRKKILLKSDLDTKIDFLSYVYVVEIGINKHYLNRMAAFTK